MAVACWQTASQASTKLPREVRFSGEISEKWKFQDMDVGQNGRPK